MSANPFRRRLWVVSERFVAGYCVCGVRPTLKAAKDLARECAADAALTQEDEDYACQAIDLLTEEDTLGEPSRCTIPAGESWIRIEAVDMALTWREVLGFFGSRFVDFAFAVLVMGGAVLAGTWVASATGVM